MSSWKHRGTKEERYPKKPREDRNSRDVSPPQMQVDMDLIKWRSVGNLVEAISAKNQRDRVVKIADYYREGIKGGSGGSTHHYSNEALSSLLKGLNAVICNFSEDSQQL